MFRLLGGRPTQGPVQSPHGQMECIQAKALVWTGTRNQHFREILRVQTQIPLGSGPRHTAELGAGAEAGGGPVL